MSERAHTDRIAVLEIQNAVMKLSNERRWAVEQAMKIGFSDVGDLIANAEALIAFINTKPEITR